MPYVLFKEPCKMLRVYKTKLPRHLTNRFIGIKNTFLSFLDQPFLTIFLY